LLQSDKEVVGLFQKEYFGAIDLELENHLGDYYWCEIEEDLW